MKGGNAKDKKLSKKEFHSGINRFGLGWSKEQREVPLSLLVCVCVSVFLCQYNPKQFDLFRASWNSKNLIKMDRAIWGSMSCACYCRCINDLLFSILFLLLL